MTTNLCGCTRPTRAGYIICDTCRADLEQHLAEMAWLDEQLDVSLTRVKGIDYNRIGSRSTETPLPWNDRASRARHELKAELVGWFRLLWVEGDPIPADRLVDIAAWLMLRLNDIAKREDAWVIWDQITRASLFARSVVFSKPAERHFIGPCEGAIDDEGEITEDECTGEIFLVEGANVAECDVCLRAYDPDAAMRARDAKLADRLFTLVEIARLAHRTFGQPEARVLNTAKAWQKKKLITAHSHVDEVARFRYQDVLERLARVYGDAS